MGTRGDLLRAGRLGTLAAFGAFVAVASCLDPTEVTLVLTTDLPCNQLNGTSITVGSAADVESKAPVTETSACTGGPGGNQTIGTFVVVPSQGSTEAFAVRVVSGVDKPVGDCTNADNYHGCIVERRELAFVPHTPLTLPIAMNLDCLNVSCQAHQTCNNGMCVSAVIPDPHLCTGAGCPADALPPLEGGSSPADAPAEASPADGHGPEVAPVDGTLADMSAPDATPDVTLSDTTVTDGMPGDAPLADSPGVDALPDGPGNDGPAGDAPADGVADAPRPDASPDSGPDASVDATSNDSGGSTDGGPPGDVVLAGCPTSASTHVACGGGTCAANQVCCVAVTGSTPWETCTSAAACNTSFVGSTVYSSLACRDRGDCPTGTVCCAVGGSVAVSVTSTCLASCPPSVNQKPMCTNTCECAAGSCSQVNMFTCGFLAIATCGGGCP